jgi:hypothetical protein
MPIQHDQILYHALGANLNDGLHRFEEAFREAEAEYRLAAVNALLDLLADPTLQDPRRLIWHRYYTARKALLQWQPHRVEEVLKAITPAPEDSSSLVPRLELLRGEAHILKGEWVPGLSALDHSVSLFQAAGEIVFAAEAEEWIARAYVNRAQSSGGWADPPIQDTREILRSIKVLFLWPIYLVIGVWLWSIGASIFWWPLILYSTNYSNWPIFRNYFLGFQAIRRALVLTRDSDATRHFRLEVARADLLRRITATRSAMRAFETLLTSLKKDDNSYRTALMKQGLGQVYLDLHKTELAIRFLQDARTIYASFEDERAVAQVDLSISGTVITPEFWEAPLATIARSLRLFEERGDLSGLADGLSRCYSILDGSYPVTAKTRTKELIRSLERCVFTARVPSRWFSSIQWVSWGVPLLTFLTLAVISTSYILTLPRNEMTKWAQATLSPLALIILIGGALGLVVIVRALSVLLGFILNAWPEATQLDYIVIEPTNLRSYDFAGHEKISMSWTAIKKFIRVEWALGIHPTAALSFEHLQTTEGLAITLPGTVAWFRHLQSELEYRTGSMPIRFRWRFYSGLILILIAVALSVAQLLTSEALPGISVPGQVWLVLLFVTNCYIALMYTTARWIWNFVRLRLTLTEGLRFMLGIGLLGLALFFLGTVGHEIVFLFGPPILFWG